jgi:hypothetical protein
MRSRRLEAGSLRLEGRGSDGAQCAASGYTAPAAAIPVELVADDRLITLFSGHAAPRRRTKDTPAKLAARMRSWRVSLLRGRAHLKRENKRAER